MTGSRGAAVAAGLAIIGASAVLSLGWVYAVAFGGGAIDAAAVYGSLSLMGMVMGAGLVVAGLGRVAHPLQATFGRRGPAPWVVAFGLTLIAGQGLLVVGGPIAALAFPVVQLLTVLCAALTILSTVTWRSGGESVRAVWSGLAYGGCVAASFALVFEAFALTTAAVAVFAVATVQGWDQALIDSGTKLMESLEAGGALDPGLVSDLVLRPAVIIAAIGLLGIVGPIGEELAKVSGVWARRPTTRYRAWFWGAAAGAGFGMTEAIALGSMVLDAWVGGMVVRAAAMLMHATMAGLAGLGWHALFVERRLARGLSLVAAAAAGHMLWNTLVVAAALFALLASRDGRPLWGVAASGAGFGLVAVFTLVFFLFRRLSSRLGREAAAQRNSGVVYSVLD